MSPHNLTFTAAAALMSAGTCPALPGDALADRIVLASPGNLNFSGSTDGMTLEAEEINEAAGPAGAGDRSVWFEWTSPSTGMAGWSLNFEGLAVVEGLALYTLAPGEGPVAMARLRPAGALVVPQAILADDRRVQLWVTAGQKFIVRVWSAPGPDGTDSGKFSAAVHMESRPQRERGDLPSTAPFIPAVTTTPNGVVTVYREYFWPGTGGSTYSTETDETFISGAWHPAGSVQWFEWTTPRTERYRFSMTNRDASLASVMVVRKDPDGSLERLSTTGAGAAFDAVRGERYLVRLGIPWRWNQGQLQLRGGPAEPGDEPATATPLTPGTSASVRFAGASPSHLSAQNDNIEGRPDVWFDLGSSLTGGFHVNVGSDIVLIYRSGAAGSLLVPVAGGAGAADSSFLAEPDHHYFARVMEWTGGWTSIAIKVTMTALSPSPANDRRAGAQVLPADGPVLIYGDATGATAEESDLPLIPDPPLGPDLKPLAPVVRPVRTVWYALDRPASAQPWFVYAWNMQDDFFSPKPSLFREENGTLVPAELPGWPWSRCALTGSRIWIMVTGNADPRFMLMARPAVSSGVTPEEAVPITAGSVHFLYAGASPRIPPSNDQTMWLSWTAAQSGLTSFSHLGSPALMTASIYAEELIPIASSVWNEQQGMEIMGQVTSFQAVAGTSYRILLHGFMPGPVAVRIKPGGWQSPYEVWTQNFPAWEKVPTFTDPEADTDGDGITNLMEMAVMETKGPHLPDPPGFPWPSPLEGASGFEMYWTERTYALLGPEGCVPLFLTGEEGNSLTDWSAVHGLSPNPNQFIGRHLYMIPQLTTPPSRFFRLRVHR